MSGDGAGEPLASGSLVAELVSSRPRPAAQWQDLFAGSWPAYIEADEVAAACLPRVRDTFAALDVALTAAASQRMVAAAWGVPLRWDGRPQTLPSGYSDALVRALADAGAGSEATPDTLVICAAQVHPATAGTGVAARLLDHLAGVGAQQGLRRVIAPLRPTLKHRYPLTPIGDYATWTRPDGLPLDPWLRTHTRMGARVVATTTASQTFTGTTAQWQEWSGLTLPTSGRYVVDGALAPLVLDTAADRGVLDEPGIWVRHR